MHPGHESLGQKELLVAEVKHHGTAREYVPQRNRCCFRQRRHVCTSLCLSHEAERGENTLHIKERFLHGRPKSLNPLCFCQYECKCLESLSSCHEGLSRTMNALFPVAFNASSYRVLKTQITGPVLPRFLTVRLTFSVCGTNLAVFGRECAWDLEGCIVF